MRITKTIAAKSYTNSSGDRIHHADNRGVKNFIAIDGEGIRTFIGYVDQPPDIESRYGMLDIGGDQLIDFMTRHEVDCGNGKTRIVHGLEFNQILEHVYKHRDDTRNTAIVGYYLGYDWSQWFKTLPENRAYSLLHNEGIAKRKKNSSNRFPFPVEYRGWEFDILDKKRFKFRKRYCQCWDNWNCEKRKCARGKWMNICDAGPFFQTSFMNAVNPKKWQKSGSKELDPVLTWSPERESMTYEELRHERLMNKRLGINNTLTEYDKLKIGKSRRSVAQADNEMAEYNLLEDQILQRAMTRLNSAFKEIGVYLGDGNWHGPGQAAEYWLKHEAKLKGSRATKKVPGLLDDIPQYILEAARSTYFGGWFCIMMHGHIPDITWEYDINSAYPYVITNLPCLEHGEWYKGSGIPAINESDIGFVYATVKSCTPLSDEWQNGRLIGTMLHRRKNMSILRPMITKGWYVWSELQAAISAGLIEEIEYGDWIGYHQICEDKPLAKVAELYEMRLTVGKETPLGKALKLLYNSMYGKFAQSTGDPYYGNPIYATLITSGCRTQIINAISTHCDMKRCSHVAMVATDGVYFVTPHMKIDAEIQAFINETGKKDDDRLGKWGRAKKINLTLFKPGVYWDDSVREKLNAGEDAQFKSRGISSLDMAPFIADIDKEFSSWGDNPPSAMPSFVNAQDIYKFTDECPLCHDTKLVNGTKCLLCDEWKNNNRPTSKNGWPIANINVRFANVSAKQAMHRNKWELVGKDISSGMTVVHSSDPESKRNSIYVDYLSDGRRVYRSLEYETGTDKVLQLWGDIEEIIDSDLIESLPYKRRFGMDDPFSDEYQEQWGETAEGTVAQIMNWELKE